MLTVFSLNPRGRRYRRALFCALAAALATPAVLTAQDAPAHHLEEKIATELQKLQPLVDAKNWDGSLALIQTLKNSAKPESYDLAFLLDIEAKIQLQKGDYAKVPGPWEQALRLHDKFKFFQPNAVQDIYYYLAQIYYQEATATKNTAAQKQSFAKAQSYLERWFANNTKPDYDPAIQEAAIFHASLLYNQAASDQENVDKELLKRAEAEVHRGLRLTTRPKDTLYILLLAINQTLNNYEKLAEILELLVKQYPAKKDYWSQLAGVYLTLANQQNVSPATAREYNIRAIISIERAQALGFMKTPKDNYTLVGVYFNVGQFGRATELLHAGLRDGSIENDQKNWELLAYSYQQVDRPLQAIDALREGAKNFPKSGQLDYQIAQVAYSLNRPEDAYKALQAAIDKGGLEKPGAVYGFLAYVAWELGKLQEAAEAVDKALASEDASRDQQLPRLKTAIEEAIREKEGPKPENDQPTDSAENADAEEPKTL
jgi:hypothetical protein